jgi:hypothetical protein
MKAPLSPGRALGVLADCPLRRFRRVPLLSVLRGAASVGLISILLGGCNDAPTSASPGTTASPTAGLPEPPDRPGRGRGAYRLTVTAVGSAVQSAAIAADGGAAAAAAPGDRGLTARPSALQFQFVATGSYTYGSRGGAGAYRYVYTVYRVRNVTGAALTNLSLLAAATSASLGGTAMSGVALAGGAAPDAATGATLARSMLPAGASALTRNGQPTASRPDVLQVIPEADVAALALPSGYSPLPYAFNVLDTATSGRVVGASAAGSYPGLILFAFRLPLQATASQDVFTFTYNFFAVTDAETRVTQSLEETDPASAAAVAARASSIGATAIHVPRGSSIAGLSGARVFCGVRTAGAQSSPAAFLGAVCANEIAGLAGVPASLSLSPGATRQISAAVAPSPGSAPPTGVAYASANPGVATVSATGLVIAVSPGTTTIAVGPYAAPLLVRTTVTVVPALNAAARRALDYLGTVMDLYHARFPVYDDVSSAGNHFHSWAKIPGELAPVTCDGSWKPTPHSGATSIHCTYTARAGAPFGGFYFQNGLLLPGDLAPRLNFGDSASAGVDLSGATALTFWARGARGGEVVDFFMGGVGRNPSTGVPETRYPDSSPVAKIRVVLGTAWRQYRIDLTGRNLTYVLGGFGWAAAMADNPAGVAFDVDDVEYELGPGRKQQRLNEPRFLRSFETRPVQPDPFDENTADDFDLVLRNLAFAYDNALSLLAFLSGGTADDLRRARLIGDAFVYAANHDRTFDDGRLRTAYAAGDIALPPGWRPNGRVGTVPVSGFYSDDRVRFYEVEQGASDVGNEAWVALALLALYRHVPDPAYLTEARRLAQFIIQFRSNTGAYRGFQGGIDRPEEPNRANRVYASTEHNLDAYAMFVTLGELTGESVWRGHAQHAWEFVEAMWDTSRRCYVAGTRDANTRNDDPGQLPADTQVWSLLAFTPARAPHAESLECARQRHQATSDGLTGYDFNDDRDGVWFEGTAHVATAFALGGDLTGAAALRQLLAEAQNSPIFGGGGIAAASHDGVTSGFNFVLYRRLHIGATAWLVFAQRTANPYYLMPFQ